MFPLGLPGLSLPFPGPSSLFLFIFPFLRFSNLSFHDWETTLIFILPRSLSSSVHIGLIAKDFPWLRPRKWQATPTLREMDMLSPWLSREKCLLALPLAFRDPSFFRAAELRRHRDHWDKFITLVTESSDVQVWNHNLVSVESSSLFTKEAIIDRFTKETMIATGRQLEFF